MTEELTPRSRLILDIVEREIAARRRSPRFPRVDETLLLALELGVAGHERAEVAHVLRSRGATDADRVLDAVYGAGAAPRARLQRRDG